MSRFAKIISAGLFMLVTANLYAAQPAETMSHSTSHFRACNIIPSRYLCGLASHCWWSHHNGCVRRNGSGGGGGGSGGGYYNNCSRKYSPRSCNHTSGCQWNYRRDRCTSRYR